MVRRADASLFRLINMTTGLHNKIAVITGAYGFIGRWLALELTSQGVEVWAMMRDAQARLPKLARWVQERGGRGELLRGAVMDLEQPGLGLDKQGLAAMMRAHHVYHLAARFDFGLPVPEARAANVEASTRLVELLAGSERLERLLHLSGYRTMGQEARALNVEDHEQLMAFYRAHGAYEGSKIEAHYRVAQAAQAYGVPLVRVSPAVVIGDSRTGESTQLMGLAQTLAQLWMDKLPALAGSAQVWLPLISVDSLAKILALAAQDEALGEQDGGHLVVFDDRSPRLEEVIDLAAKRMGKRAPRHHLPVGLLKAIPQRLSGLEPESLSFISEDRYDPQPLAAFLERHGLSLPPIERSIERWVDALLDTGFGRQPWRGGAQEVIAGTPTFIYGDRRGAKQVFFHGALLESSSWEPVLASLKAPWMSADLPGLGHSLPGHARSPRDWTRALMAHQQAQPVMVGHSLGAMFALEYAAQAPERVGGLVLLSPFFLQRRAGLLYRQPWLVQAMLCMGDKAQLERRLGQHRWPEVNEASWALLKRGHIRAQTAQWLRYASRPQVRERCQALLASLQVPTLIIDTADDPITLPAPKHAQRQTLARGGHYPQLADAPTIAALIERFTHEQEQARAMNILS